MKCSVLVFIALIGLVTDVRAQWIYDVQESAFSDRKLHIMLTAKGAYGFGLRCQREKIQIVYFTAEKVDDISSFNSMKANLKTRIDKNDVREFSVVAQSSDGKLTFVADADTDLAEEIRNAKRRVAVVVDVFGMQFHEQQFNVLGSTKAAEQFLSNCQTTS